MAEVAASCTTNDVTISVTEQSGESTIETVKFKVPQHEVKTLQSLAKWSNSQAYKDVMGFILTMNEAMKNRRLTDECHVSQSVSNILKLLDTLSKWVDEIPPSEQAQRFGNKSFRTWSKKLVDNSQSIIDPILPEHCKDAVIELQPYLNESFGNSTRIDYGTGHELNFLFFLCSLYKLHILTELDYIATGCKVFMKYLEFVRKLQQTYHMEPAGSQGVWGLDDHQFVPYIWGSNQLVDHGTIVPADIPNVEKAKKYKLDYMFFDCIDYINAVKTGPFAEHSNALWGISSVPYWNKVNSGLIRMYRNEVLSKFPVIQHLVFGNIMKFDKAT